MSSTHVIEQAGKLILACDQSRTLPILNENGDIETLPGVDGTPCAVLVHEPIIRLLVAGCLPGAENRVVEAIVRYAALARESSIGEIHVVAAAAVTELIEPALSQHGFENFEGVLVKRLKALAVN